MKLSNKPVVKYAYGKNGNSPVIITYRNRDLVFEPNNLSEYRFKCYGIFGQLSSTDLNYCLFHLSGDERKLIAKEYDKFVDKTI